MNIIYASSLLPRGTNTPRPLTRVTNTLSLATKSSKQALHHSRWEETDTIQFHILSKMSNRNGTKTHMSHLMIKPTKWVCAQQRLRSVWASKWRLWSDWADAQADLSPQWAHSHFVGLSWGGSHTTQRKPGGQLFPSRWSSRIILNKTYKK